MNDFLTHNAFWILAILKIAVLVFIVLTVNAYLTWFERKVVAHIQSRWGPHRVGPHGLLQPAADGLKFLFKEDPTPAGVDKFTFYLAPLLALSLALTALAVIPFGPKPIPYFKFFGEPIHLWVANSSISLLILFSITALSVYGVALAGWASNSKYPLLGGLRSSAQMISYELALTMSVVGVLLMANSFNLNEIITAQSHSWGFLGWNIFGFNGKFPVPQVLGFVCFVIAAFAETNRAPFDLPEAESELVAGFHTEYASFKFAMFFIAEYTAMITVSCLVAILFLGGWLSPVPESWTAVHYLPSIGLIPFGLWVIYDGIKYETVFGKLVLPAVGFAMVAIGAALIAFPNVNDFIQPTFWLLSKIFVVLFFYVWARGTLPRLRYDQLMNIGWKVLLPASIFNVVYTAFVLLLRGR